MGLHTDWDAWKLMCSGGCPDTERHRNAVLEIHKQKKEKKCSQSVSGSACLGRSTGTGHSTGLLSKTQPLCLFLLLILLPRSPEPLPRFYFTRRPPISDTAVLPLFQEVGGSIPVISLTEDAPFYALLSPGIETRAR